MNITLTIEDRYTNAFLTFIKTLSYVKVKEQKTETITISEQHKMLVRERVKNTKHNELLDWDKVKNDFKFD